MVILELWADDNQPGMHILPVRFVTIETLHQLEVSLRPVPKHWTERWGIGTHVREAYRMLRRLSR